MIWISGLVGATPAPPGPAAAKPAWQQCAAAVEAHRDGRHAAIAAVTARSAYLGMVLGESNRADFDGVGGACRLVDSAVERDVFINDGAGDAALFEPFSELLEFARKPLPEEEEGPRPRRHRGAGLDGAAGALHADLGAGVRHPGRGGAGPGLAPGPTAVPETAPYLMLLGGLALLLARRRGRRAGPAAA